MADTNDEYSKAMNIRVTTVILTTIGIVLNVICITALLSIKGSLRTHLKLLLSLSVSDCILDIGFMLMAVMDIVDASEFTKLFGITVSEIWIFYDAMSALTETVTWICLLTMLSLAVDLFLRVKKPLNYKQLMSRRRGNILLACIWTLSIVVCSGLNVVLIYHEEYHLNAVITSYTKDVAIMISFIIFCVLYSCIIIQVRAMSTNRSRAVRRTVVTSILILMSYVICVVVRAVWTMIRVVFIKQFNLRIYTVYVGMDCLFIVNTIIDPIIYVTRVPEVRGRLKSALQYVQRLRACKVTGSVDTDITNLDVTDITNLPVTDITNLAVTDTITVPVTDNTNVSVTDNTNVFVTDNTNVFVTDKTNVTVMDDTKMPVAEKTNVVVTNNTIETATENNKIAGTDITNVPVTDKTNVTVMDNTNMTVSDNINVTELDNTNVTATDNTNMTTKVSQYYT